MASKALLSEPRSGHSRRRSVGWRWRSQSRGGVAIWRGVCGDIGGVTDDIAWLTGVGNRPTVGVRTTPFIFKRTNVAACCRRVGNNVRSAFPPSAVAAAQSYGIWLQPGGKCRGNAVWPMTATTQAYILCGVVARQLFIQCVRGFGGVTWRRNGVTMVATRCLPSNGGNVVACRGVAIGWRISGVVISCMSANGGRGCGVTCIGIKTINMAAGVAYLNKLLAA